MRKPILYTTIAVLTVHAATPSLAQHEHADIEIGTSSGLVLFAEIPDEPIVLEPAGGLINGWSAAEPGIFEVEAPEGDLFPLQFQPKTGIRLELVSADPGFFFLEAGGFTPLNTPGAFASLGLESGAVHSHPTWVIDANVVGAGFSGTLDATFRLVDSLGGYAASENFTLQFTNIAEVHGDLDGDGDIDGVDLGIAFSNFAGPGVGGKTEEQGDLDGDGDIDGVDLAQMFGAFTGPQSPTAVPEPASALYVLAGFGLLGARRRG